jgi:hypothetical protein
MLSSVFGDLVDAGTIAMEQESAITEAISSAIPQDGPGRAAASSPPGPLSRS